MISTFEANQKSRGVLRVFDAQSLDAPTSLDHPVFNSPTLRRDPLPFMNPRVFPGKPRSPRAGFEMAADPD
jgi:hypothetical protein